MYRWKWATLWILAWVAGFFFFVTFDNFVTLEQHLLTNLIPHTLPTISRLTQEAWHTLWWVNDLLDKWVYFAINLTGGRWDRWHDTETAANYEWVFTTVFLCHQYRGCFLYFSLDSLFFMKFQVKHFVNRITCCVSSSLWMDCWETVHQLHGNQDSAKQIWMMSCLPLFIFGLLLKFVSILVSHNKWCTWHNAQRLSCCSSWNYQKEMMIILNLFHYMPKNVMDLWFSGCS